MNAVILLIGFGLDWTLGDPPRLPHIVVGIGKIIALSERVLRSLFPATPRDERIAGGILAAAVTALSLCVPALVFAVAGSIHPALRFTLECCVCFQLLATKSLSDAALRVHAALARNDLPAARTAVGMIVGVAENASDGVVAPMLYFALGGAPLMLAYKAINTMDSMIGYKNAAYLHFGRAAARLDDAANFLPARLTAYLMILAAALSGRNEPGRRLDWRGALRIHRRDRRAHSSPNAGHPEAACAGALGIRLGGDSTYGGTLVRKPTIGDAARGIIPDDILRAVGLMRSSAVLALCLCVFFLLRRTPLWF